MAADRVLKTLGKSKAAEKYKVHEKTAWNETNEIDD